MSDIYIHVIIATSNKRFDLLFDRAIDSVYKQNFCKNVDILIVDDNISDEAMELRARLKQKRKLMKLEKKFPTKIIRNFRTKGNSGTGAWNSAALSLVDIKNLKTNNRHFLAFLDDDDAWDNNYLQECYKCIKNNSRQVALVVSGIKFIENNNFKILLPSKANFTKEHIFIKNPHIQGSNLFINLAVFLKIGGFDESLKSTTDRDLIMRFVEFYKCNQRYKIKIIKKPLVNYFYDKNLTRVTNTFESKRCGLDLFYRKYFDEFSKSIQEKSMQIAKERFNYKINISQEVSKEQISNDINMGIDSINIIMGLISYDKFNLIAFMESFNALKPKDSSFLKDFRICILTTTKMKKYCKEIKQKYKYKMDFIFIDSKQSIATSRTILQNSIYKIGLKNYDKNFATWIIDDDMEFCGLDSNGRYNIDYFYFIAKYSKSNFDALISKNCNEPPLPFFSTLRIQLLDLYFNLKRSNAKAYKIRENLCYGDFYYDLSSNNFDFLEYPFFIDISIEKHLDSVLKRQMLTRKIRINKNDIGKIGKDSIYRGGNCIIYNPELLKTNNFTPSKLHRRSDFNWAIINSILLKYTIKEITLPLFHKREKRISLKEELEKIEGDLLGMVFYRIFLTICKNLDNPKQDKLLFKELSAQYDSEIKILKQKIIFNIFRIQALKTQINEILPHSLQDKSKQLSIMIEKYIACLKRFCRKDFQLDKKVYKKCLRNLMFYLDSNKSAGNAPREN